MRFLRLWLPALLWAALILAASTDQFSVGQSGGWLRRLTGRQLPQGIHFTIRKAAHVFEYGVLAALWFRAVAGTWKGRTRAFAAAMLLVCAVAFLDEFRQSRTRLRRGALDDVVLDVSAAGLTLAVIARRRGRGRAEASPAGKI